MLRKKARILIVVLAVLGALNIVYIPGGSFAVRESPGAALPLGPGLHLRVPLYQRVYRYDSLPVTLDQPVTIVTKDSASFTLPVTISARASQGDVLTFHRGRAGRESRTYIEERAREAVLAAAREINADEILARDASTLLGPAVSAALISHGIADDGLKVGRPTPQVVLNAVVDYLRRDLAASARRLAERALAGNPREALYHAAMGAVLQAEGKTAAAEDAYIESLYLDPAALEPMSRLNLMYQTTNDPDKILRLERLLVASLEKKKESSIHYDWLGQVYLRTGHFDKAEMAFKTAIGLAPREAAFHISLGSLRVKQGKYQEGRAAYEEALALHPNHPLALYNLGVAYAVEGQTDRAIEVFHRAERSGPPGYPLLNSLGQAYEVKGDLRRSAEYLRRSLAINPRQPARQAELKRIESRLRKRG
ncbi:MAG: tetratricopeptide repeat protein [Acidobacteria bacterium]|nr:tetratricopeptide repeat protein [Acidobacteriota bacterium]